MQILKHPFRSGILLTALRVLALVPRFAGAVPGHRPAADQPLTLTLSDTKIRSILARYQATKSLSMSGPFEDVIVLAPAEQAPMRDVTQEVWGGLAAPLWAILHPAQSWRIFLPIPPR